MVKLIIIFRVPLPRLTTFMSSYRFLFINRKQKMKGENVKQSLPCSQRR